MAGEAPVGTKLGFKTNGKREDDPDYQSHEVWKMAGYSLWHKGGKRTEVGQLENSQKIEPLKHKAEAWEWAKDMRLTDAGKIDFADLIAKESNE